MSFSKKLLTLSCVLFLITACGKSADELFQEGRTLMDNQQYAEALPFLKEAVEKDPMNGSIHNAMGVALLRLDSMTASVAAFNRAVEADSSDYRPFYNRGNAKRVLGNDQGALEDYNKAIELAPGVADIYANRGTIYAKYQDFDNALFDFDYALGLDDQNPRIYLFKGRIELRNSNSDGIDQDDAIEDAIFNFKKALALDETLGEAWYWMGLAEIARENKPEGCEFLQSASQNGFQQADNAIAQNCLQ